MDECIKEMWHIYIYYEILLSRKKDEILPFATTWMEGIMLREISQRKTNTVLYHICGIKKQNKGINQTKPNKDKHINKRDHMGYMSSDYQ